MRRQVQQWVWFGAVWLGLMGGLPSAEAVDRVALFVVTTKSSPALEKMGAWMNWAAQQRALPQITAAKLELLNRGLFFDESVYSGAKRWRKRGVRVLEEGLQNYTSNPSSAVGMLLRGSRFLGFGFKYDLDFKHLRKALLLLGVLQFRKGEKKKGIRSIAQGLTVAPQEPFPSEVQDDEKKLLEAVRCKKSAQAGATLEVDPRSPYGEVFVNGQRIGLGKTRIRGLFPGQYYVTVARDGYRNWYRQLRLRPGQNKKLRVRSFRRSPNQEAFAKLCTTMLGAANDEQLTYEMRKALGVFGSQSVQRLMLACLQPGNKMTWFTIQGEQGKATKGNVKVPSNLAGQQNALTAPLQSLGLAGQAPLPKIREYKLTRTQGACEDPRKIALAALEKKVGETPQAASWTETTGDHIVVKTKHGFRLQGKVLSIRGPILTLEVAGGRRAPNELRSVQIHRKDAEWSWILGPKQEGGYRIGERLIIQTIYQVNVTGFLVADDGDRIRVRTARGVESIPWSMIRRLVRRDQ